MLHVTRPGCGGAPVMSASTSPAPTITLTSGAKP
jgi:hypothetical protein